MLRKNIAIITLLAVVVFLLIAGFLVLSNFISQKAANILPNQKDVETPKDTAGQPEQPAIGAKETTAGSEADSGKSAFDLAKEKKDVVECFKLEDKALAEACVSLVAQFLADTKSCSVIKDEAKAAECVDMVVFDKAMKSGSASACSEIKGEGLSASCINNLIDQQKVKEGDCASLASREKEICQGYFSYLNDNEAFKNAKSKEDCGKIIDETVKQFCLDKIEFPL